jgi:hypothetical protein
MPTAILVTIFRFFREPLFIKANSSRPDSDTELREEKQHFAKSDEVSDEKIF